MLGSQYLQIYCIDHSAKYTKEIYKRRTLRAQMQLIHVLTNSYSKQIESLHVLKSR